MKMRRERKNKKVKKNERRSFKESEKNVLKDLNFVKDDWLKFGSVESLCRVFVHV